MQEMTFDQIDAVNGGTRTSTVVGCFIVGALLGGTVGAFAAGGVSLGAGAPLGALAGGAVGGLGGLVAAWYMD